MNRLPADRHALVVENRGLVGYSLSRMRLTRHRHYDDLWSEGAVGLLNAAALYDPSNGAKFSTYAVVSIVRRIRHVVRLLDRQHVEVHIEGLAWLPGDDGDAIADSAQSRETREIVEEAIAALPPRMAVVMRGKLAGKNLPQIGRELGVTREAVRQIFTRAVARMREMKCLASLV